MSQLILEQRLTFQYIIILRFVCASFRLDAMSTTIEHAADADAESLTLTTGKSVYADITV